MVRISACSVVVLRLRVAPVDKGTVKACACASACKRDETEDTRSATVRAERALSSTTLPASVKRFFTR